MILAARIPPPANVFRGINVPDDLAKQLVDEAAAAKASGEPMAMKGFLSTSTSPETDFMTEANVEFHIKAVHGLDMKPYSNFPDEKELLLNHGSRFRVLLADKHPTEGKWRIELEQLPPEE